LYLICLDFSTPNGRVAVKGKIVPAPNYAMKACEELYVLIHIFLDLSTIWRWSASRPCCFTPKGRAHGTHWIGSWVDPRAGLDDVEKKNFLTLPRLELRPLGCPARNQSPCRLRYSDPVRVALKNEFQTIIKEEVMASSEALFQQD
jgi:hypothetical protein